jgi:tRNA pseudouridine55 synthase
MDERLMRPSDPLPTPEDILEGAVFLIDKPLTWTSFDVVNKLRWRLRSYTGQKGIKVGHAGTLDPLATGLLILCCGKYTKRIESYMGMDKTYTGTIKLGVTTPSYDLESEFDQTFPTAHITPELVHAVTPQFVGDIMQLPPIFSAIKIDGQRAYTSARKGQEIIMEPRPIRINSLIFNDLRLPDALDFEVSCTKGTYIRSLAHDFGKALDSGSCLSALCRTQIGHFDIKDAWTLTDLIEKLRIEN